MSGMGDDEVNRVRLLPWTGTHGRACLLLTDGDGTVSRFADRVEDVQLGLGERLLSRLRDALPVGHVNVGEFDALATQLADALGDALLIARSRGARLGGAKRDRSGRAPAVTSAEEISLGLSASRPSKPRARGLMSFPGHDLASAPAARRYVRDTVSLWGLRCEGRRGETVREPPHPHRRSP
ncbi:hypothetical protein SGFS_051040 [Streptomyces graminofaciens]|uniref:Uncharacterized protein n=1 Tax=Streptomyces graminofaciens TaxID=68212 RepID=A0ABN5VKM8_9ACTN|nr:hypothetical protein SGFS_051040 [Streptomyces graminofaciens]